MSECDAPVGRMEDQQRQVERSGKVLPVRCAGDPRAGRRSTRDREAPCCLGGEMRSGGTCPEGPACGLAEGNSGGACRTWFSTSQCKERLSLGFRPRSSSFY